MKQTYTHYQVRQLARLQRKLAKLLATGASASHRLVRRLQFRISRLLVRVGLEAVPAGVRTGLAAAAVVLVGTGANAQNFEAPVAEPFGLATDTSSAALSVPIGAYLDADGDGDLDYFGTYPEYAESIVYRENTGSATAPQFGAPTLDPFGLDVNGDNNPVIPYAVDFDLDGDMDLVTIGFGDGVFRFLENTSTSAQVAFASGVSLNVPDGVGIDVYSGFGSAFTDIDGDGDTDLIIGNYGGSGIAFAENTGTASAPDFAAPVINAFGLDTGAYLESITAGDIDEDGDIDLLSRVAREDPTDPYNYDGVGLWVFRENTGTATAPQFAAPVDSPFGLTRDQDRYISVPVLVDIDADGDLDIMESAYNDDSKDWTVEFFENKTMVSTQAAFERVDISPNPATDFVRLECEEHPQRVEVRDATGRLVHIELNSKRVDVSGLQPGVFQLHAVLSDGTRYRSSLVKR